MSQRFVVNQQICQKNALLLTWYDKKHMFQDYSLLYLNRKQHLYIIIQSDTTLITTQNCQGLNDCKDASCATPLHTNIIFSHWLKINSCQTTLFRVCAPSVLTDTNTQTKTANVKCTLGPPCTCWNKYIGETKYASVAFYRTWPIACDAQSPSSFYGHDMTCMER